MAENELTEADVARSVAAAFGRHQDAASPAMRAALLEAGYGEAMVERGLRMWGTGSYVDFTDLATSLGTQHTLGTDNRPVAPGVTESRIAEAAVSFDKRVQEQRS